MGKFSGRLNAVFKKTHGFVSYDDLCLVREYFQSRFDEEKKPDDFDEKVREVELLNEKMLRSDDPALVARFRELISAGSAIWLRAAIPDAVSLCEKYPTGIWLDNFLADAYRSYAKAARRYFADRKRE